MKRSLESRKPVKKWTVSDVFKKRSKYGNRRVEKNGEKFDSVREYERHLVLLDMQKRLEINKLRRQPRYDLRVGGVSVGTYVGDWVYEDLREGGRLVVEDAKGFQTPEFKLKWKLAKALYPEIDWRLS